MTLILIPDRIITAEDDQILEGYALAIDEEGRIERLIAPDEVTSIQAKEKVLTYPGCSICPGLIDMHNHVGYEDKFPVQLDGNDFSRAFLALDDLQSAFKMGVTTVRDVASPAGLAIGMIRAAEAGAIIIPRLITCGRGLCMSGGHDWRAAKSVRQVDGPGEIRKAIREEIRDGAEWIKILNSSRVYTPEFTQEELDAAVNETHRLGKRACVHAGTPISIEMSILAGFDTIEHGTYLTLEGAEMMRRNQQTWVPTIMIHECMLAEMEKKVSTNMPEASSPAFQQGYAFYQPLVKAYRQNFGELVQKGVNIVTGTDMVLNAYPAYPVPQEAGYMVRYGMQPLQALRAASANAADTLGLQNEIGCIKPGMWGDLVVVKGNPAREIGELENVIATYLKGKLVYQAN